ncbi:MAG: YkgJ family cysteine cluster protein [Chlamydiia bacterium]|nr:YkgJ family cysteine cluster protein [Chlamydiia bacterium]
MSIFDILDCKSCGDCCKHSVRHVAPTEVGAEETPINLYTVDGMVRQKNSDCGDCLFLKDNFGDVICTQYNDHDYPETCQHYPFYPSDNGKTLIISTGCTRSSRIVDEYLNNPTYTQEVLKYAINMKKGMSKNFKAHCKTLVSKFRAKIELKL